MPRGKGTYGSKRGRPTRRVKAAMKRTTPKTGMLRKRK